VKWQPVTLACIAHSEVNCHVSAEVEETLSIGHIIGLHVLCEVRVDRLRIVPFSLHLLFLGSSTGNKRLGLKLII
jgi:hypothetical protein